MEPVQIGPVTMYHGECLSVMSMLPSGSIDMVLADLPYGEVSQKSSGLRKLDRGNADRCDINLNDLINEYVRLCSGSFYVFCGTEQISTLISLFKDHGLTTRLAAWEKTNPSPMNGDRLWLSGMEFCVFARKPNAVFNEHCKKALWQSPSGRSKIHPTEKPLPLFERLIAASTVVGHTVLDNTSGSGTTGVAANKLGRKAILIEQDIEHFNTGLCRVADAVWGGTCV